MAIGDVTGTNVKCSIENASFCSHKLYSGATKRTFQIETSGSGKSKSHMLVASSCHSSALPIL